MLTLNEERGSRVGHKAARGRVQLRLAAGLLLGLVLTVPFALWARGQSQPAPSSVDTIQKQLGAGPIQIKAATVKQLRLSQKEAEERVRLFTGLPSGKARTALPVLFTDREFTGGNITDRPAWLFEYDGSLLPLGELKRDFVFCVVIDDTTKQFLTGFTYPRGPWWEEIPVRNEAFQRHLHERGRRAKVVSKVPSVPLHRAIEAISEGDFYDYYTTGKQIIVRLFDYSELSGGILIVRVDGAEIVPTLLNQPTWEICFEGVKAERLSSRGKASRPYREARLLLDARTGKTRSLRLSR